MSKSHRFTFRNGKTVVVTMATALILAGCTGQSTPAATPPTNTQPTNTQPGTSQPGTSGAVTGTSSAAAPQSVAGARIPPGLLLPNENEKSKSAEMTDWTTDNTAGQAWLLDPCRPTAYPTDKQRTGFRTVSRTGPELRQARQLAAFGTEDVAVEAVAGFRRVLAACKTGGDPAQGSGWQWVVGDARIGDEGFVAASTTGGPGFGPFGNRIAVTRVGSLVFLAYEEGEYGAAELDEGAQQTRRVAEQFAARR